MATSTEHTPAAERDDHVLEIVRTFAAPRALVFRMWSDPEHIVRWHGPEGFWLTHCEQDFRVGGTWRRCMSSGPGHEHWISGVFREIREPERLSFTYVNDHDGHEMLVEMDFLDRGHETEMHFRQSRFASVAERDGHGWGWNSGFDLLATYLLSLDPSDLRPVGAPRIDGVAADIAAARKRHEAERRSATAGSAAAGEKSN